MYSQSNEILFDNLVDIEIQRIFMPLNFMQRLYFLPKFNIYENYITFNTAFVNVTSTLFVFALVTLLYVRCYLFLRDLLNESFTFLCFILIFDALYYSAGFFMSLFLNLIFSKQNVGLVLNIQKFFKLIHCKNNKYFTKFNFYSWLFVPGIIFCNIFFLVMLFITGSLLKYHSALCCVFTCHFDMNLICAIRIISLLNFQLKLWISQFKYTIKKITDSTSHAGKHIIKNT